MRKIAWSLLLVMVILGVSGLVGCKDNEHPDVPLPQNINFIGDVDSRIYHFPTCPQKPLPEDSVYFDAPLAATRAGFHPCPYCDPPAPASGP